MVGAVDVAEQLKRLKQTFVDGLPERRDAIKTAWALVLDNPLDMEALSELRNSSHKLVGSGATFGFMDLSNLAREVEHLLDPILDSGASPADVLDQIGPKLDRVSEAIDIAMAGQEEGAPQDTRPMVILGSNPAAAPTDFACQLEAAGYQVKPVISGVELLTAVSAHASAKVVAAAELADGPIEQVLSILRGQGTSMPRVIIFGAEGPRAAALQDQGACDVLAPEAGAVPLVAALSKHVSA